MTSPHAASLIAFLATISLSIASCSKPSTTNAPSDEPAAPKRADETHAQDAGTETLARADATVSGTDTSPAADAPADIGGSWVRFHRTPYTGATGSHEGPDWSFEGPNLPAISEDGSRVVFAKQNVESLGAAPNLAVIVVRATDEGIMSSTPLLTQEEFVAAVDAAKPRGSDEARVARAFKDLGVRVQERVERLNKDLSAQKWTAIPKCTVDPIEGAPYVCAMKAQGITCGGTKFVYRPGQLAVSTGARKATLSRPAWISRPAADPNSGGRIPVKSCFASMAFDPSRGVAVGELLQICQGGGDWCSAPASWHVVVIPK